MSKTVNINGESKTVDKVALWWDSGHTAREMFVPEGTVPDGYVPDAAPTVTATAGISRSGTIVTARADAEAACHGHTVSDSDTETLDLTQGTGLEAAAIIAGRSVLGIIGTATADATAGAADIASGKTAYINGVKVVGSMMPETCPVPTYDTPSVSVSVGLSSDNSKVTASASATANGKTGAGTGEATLASLGLVKPTRTQAGGTITPGAEQVIPAGTYLSAALTILAASGGGGTPEGMTEILTGELTVSSTTTTKTHTFNISVNPVVFILYDLDFTGSPGEMLFYVTIKSGTSQYGAKGGVRGNAAAGTLSVLASTSGFPSKTGISIQGGGANLYSLFAGHRYRWYVWG